MEVRDEAYLDYKRGLKYKEIAEKYDVTISAVKSWASRYWKTKDSKMVAPETKKVATKSSAETSKKLQPSATSKPKKRGAPKGNKNTVGNKNNYKHGLYSRIYFDTLTEDETDMIKDLRTYSEEDLLVDQIALLTVRERRLMQSIKKYTEGKGGQSLSSVFTSEDKRRFENDEDKEEYERRQKEKVSNGDRLPGTAYHVNTTTEANYNIIQRLEDALTKVQDKKLKAIESLNRLRSQKNADAKDEVVDDWVSAVMGCESNE